MVFTRQHSTQTGEEDKGIGRMPPMNYRTLGRTGMKVSEIGFGAWGIGARQWIGASDDESVRALSRAIDLGLNLIDTALAYGEGPTAEFAAHAGKRRKG